MATETGLNYGGTISQIQIGGIYYNIADARMRESQMKRLFDLWSISSLETNNIETFTPKSHEWINGCGFAVKTGKSQYNKNISHSIVWSEELAREGAVAETAENKWKAAVNNYFNNYETHITSTSETERAKEAFYFPGILFLQSWADTDNNERAGSKLELRLNQVVNDTNGELYGSRASTTVPNFNFNANVNVHYTNIFIKPLKDYCDAIRSELRVTIPDSSTSTGYDSTSTVSISNRMRAHYLPFVWSWAD